MLTEVVGVSTKKPLKNVMVSDPLRLNRHWFDTNLPENNKFTHHDDSISMDRIESIVFQRFLKMFCLTGSHELLPWQLSLFALS